MKGKIGLASLIVIVLSLSIYGTISKVRTTNAATPPLSVTQKLESLFGEQAKDLRIIETRNVSGKEVSTLKGQIASFNVDGDGNLLSYLKLNVNPNSSSATTVDEAKIAAVKFAKTLTSGEDLDSFEFQHEVVNRGSGDFNQFQWTKTNNNGVVVKSILVSTTQSGEVFGYAFKNDDVPSAEIQPKITRDEAADIIITNKANAKLTRDKIKISKVSKAVLNDRLYWYVQIILPPPTPELTEIHESYYVDALTGEINTNPLQ